MKKILITGVNGNLGGALTKEIINETDYEIIAVANSEEKIIEMLLREDIKENKRIKFLTQDDFFCKQYDADVVVHMAFARANRCNKDIALSLDYTRKVYEHLSDNVPIIYISSQSIYGSTSCWRSEDLPAAPESVYSMAKYAGEKLLEIRKAGTYTSLRLDYVIQSQNMVSTLCKSIKKDRIINLRGGMQTFSYIDRIDVAKAIIALLRTEKRWRPVYNVGHNKMRFTLIEMANVIKTVAYKNGINDISIKLHEDDTKFWSGMDSTLFMMDTGWKPTLDIYQMVEGIFLKI